MGLSEKQMAHPRFMKFEEIANSALETAFLLAGLDFDKLHDIEGHAGRAVDQITALMIRVDRMGER